jgi:thymidylate kinase
VRTALHADDEALLANLAEPLRKRNGVPTPDGAAARDRAADIVAGTLADLLQPGGLRTSVLGPGWSRDIDVHVTSLPDPSRLAGLGWIRLDGLIGKLGHAGEGRWAVTENGVVLALADFSLEPPPDVVRSLLARCRRRGEVRAREVLELRALLRSGVDLPPQDLVLGVAAGVEAGLDGDALDRWRSGPPVPAPAALPSSGRSGLIGRIRRMASGLRPGGRAVIALSGIDGAGKSTLAMLMARDLDRVGLPAKIIWTRPGMRLGLVGRLGGAAKRLFGQDSSTGLERIGRGEPAGSLASRRGPLGWAWSMLVALSFVRDARGQHRRGRGILIYDRHLLDALVTLDVVYEGVHLRLQRALVSRLLPKADLTLLLTIPAQAALARKPGDMFVQAVLERQSDRYSALRSEVPGLHELDATRPAEELAAEAFRLVAAIGSHR